MTPCWAYKYLYTLTPCTVRPAGSVKLSRTVLMDANIIKALKNHWFVTMSLFVFVTRGAPVYFSVTLQSRHFRKNRL